MRIVRIVDMKPLTNYFVGVYEHEGVARVLDPYYNWIGNSGRYVSTCRASMEHVLTNAIADRPGAQAVLVSLMLLNDGSLRAYAHKLGSY